VDKAVVTIVRDAEMEAASRRSELPVRL